ncbi:unnamed protein product [Leuciscus chuanchicus]
MTIIISLLLLASLLPHLTFTAHVNVGIVNGNEAKPHSRPYMVSIQTNGEHICGGFLISNEFVLTAAHCWDRFETLTVVVGAHDLKNIESSDRFGVKSYIPHPNFGNNRNDIMLLRPGSLLKTAIMGKTADLTAVQKAIIDTLKQEGKTQKEISERIGCSQSAVSRHLSGKSVGRKKCGKKRCTTRRGDRTLRKIVDKDRFQTLEDLRKQWTESGVETSRATVHRRVQEMGYRCRIPKVKPLLNQKQRQKRLTWATEKQHWTVAQWLLKFCMSFGNQGARVWRKTGEKEMPKCLKSSVKYPQSVMVWGAMSAAGVGPLCFIKGRVNAASYQEILEHSMLPSAEKLYGVEDFILQHDLAPAHSAKTTGKWFTEHGITVLNWPANSSDLNPIENLWDIVKRKLRDARPNTLDELKAAIEASWASITPQQCHRLIASMPCRIEAVISAKRIPDQVLSA